MVLVVVTAVVVLGLGGAAAGRTDIGVATLLMGLAVAAWSPSTNGDTQANQDGGACPPRLARCPLTDSQPSARPEWASGARASGRPSGGAAAAPEEGRPGTTGRRPSTGSSSSSPGRRRSRAAAREARDVRVRVARGADHWRRDWGGGGPAAGFEPWRGLETEWRGQRQYDRAPSDRIDDTERQAGLRAARAAEDPAHPGQGPAPPGDAHPLPAAPEGLRVPAPPPKRDRDRDSDSDRPRSRSAARDPHGAAAHLRGRRRTAAPGRQEVGQRSPARRPRGGRPG